MQRRYNIARICKLPREGNEGEEKSASLTLRQFREAIGAPPDYREQIDQ
jgi:hypothetical protein